jgi:hypothetical protein
MAIKSAGAVFGAVGLLLAAAAGPVHAAAAPEGAAWIAVSDATLAQARGGFDPGNGLLVSLGVERLVLRNGGVVSSQALNIVDAASGAGALTLLQNGAAVTGPMAGAFGATVIQNNLNNQVLRTETIISGTLTSASLLTSMNFQGSLRDALAHSVSAP